MFQDRMAENPICFPSARIFPESLVAENNAGFHLEIGGTPGFHADNSVWSFYAEISCSVHHNGWFNTTLDIGFGSGLEEYIVHLKAEDIAGNGLRYDHTVKGLFAGVLDFVRDIWNAVAGALQKAWNSFMDALSWLLEWIIEQAINLLSGIKSLLTSLMELWIMA